MLLHRATPAGQDVRRDVDLDRRLTLRQLCQKTLVMLRIKSMPDPLGTNIQRGSDLYGAFYRPARLASMGREPQSRAPCLHIRLAEVRHRPGDLVAPDPNAHDAGESTLEPRCEPEHLADVLGPPLPRRVRDPQQRELPSRFRLGAEPRPLHGGHDVLDAEFRSLPVQDVAPRDEDLGVGDALGAQVPHHLGRDQRIVVGRLQPVTNELKGAQEVTEVLVVV